jgi:hypothetical protein
MEEEKTVSELVSDLDKELREISLYFQDKDIDEALTAIVRLISKPDATRAAAPLVVKLQALSTKFALAARYYMLYDTDETKEAKTRKKNTLMTLSAELEKLSNAVKYLVRN